MKIIIDTVLLSNVGGSTTQSVDQQKHVDTETNHKFLGTSFNF